MSTIASKPISITMKSIHASFSGRVSDINCTTNDVNLFKDGVDISIKMRSTVGNIRQYISVMSGIPRDHIVLLAQPPSGEATKLNDNEKSIIGALKPDRSLSFEFIKCDDKLHCADMVKIKNVFGATLKQPFSEEMTVAELKKILESTNYKLFYRSKELNDADTMKTAGITAEDRLFMVPANKTTPKIHHDPLESKKL